MMGRPSEVARQAERHHAHAAQRRRQAQLVPQVLQQLTDREFEWLLLTNSWSSRGVTAPHVATRVARQMQISTNMVYNHRAKARRKFAAAGLVPHPEEV